MKQVWVDFWELFFPRCCVICGRLLSRDECFLCLPCLSGLPRTGMHLQKGNEVERNFWGKFPVVRATSFFYYAKGGDVRQLLYELKYYGNKRMGVVLGKYMAAELLLSDFFKGIDCLIPVPLHPEKERRRGYNQSERLAAGVASATRIPVVPDVLARSRYTATQTRKSQYERWENVAGLFACEHPEHLENKHILLVDDVLTTGATIVACADAIKHIPGIRISVLTLALAGDG